MPVQVRHQKTSPLLSRFLSYKWQKPTFTSLSYQWSKDWLQGPQAILQNAAWPEEGTGTRPGGFWDLGSTCRSSLLPYMYVPCPSFFPQASILRFSGHMLGDYKFLKTPFLPGTSLEFLGDRQDWPNLIQVLTSNQLWPRRGRGIKYKHGL